MILHPDMFQKGMAVISHLVISSDITDGLGRYLFIIQ